MSESLVKIIDSHRLLFDFLNHGKTGIIQSYPDDRKLYFDRGHLVYAGSDVPGEHFSDFLVFNDIIDRNQLAALREALQPGESLGKKLKAEGFATPKDLAKALKQQITTVVERMVADVEGTTMIYDENLPPKLPRLKIQSIGLFGRALFRLDGDQLLPEFDSDWFIRLSPHAEARMAQHPPTASLEPILDILRGNHSLTAQALADSQAWSEEDLKHYLYLLFALDWLDIGNATSDVLDDEVLESHELLDIEEDPDADALATVLPDHAFTQESLQADAETWNRPKQDAPEDDEVPEQPDSLADTPDDPYAELTDNTNIHLDLTAELMRNAPLSEEASLPSNEAEILEESSAYLEQKVFETETQGMNLDTIPPEELELETPTPEPQPHLFDEPTAPQLTLSDSHPRSEPAPESAAVDEHPQSWQPPLTPQEQIRPDVSFLAESDLASSPTVPMDVILPDQEEGHEPAVEGKKSAGLAKWLLAALVILAIGGTAYFFLMRPTQPAADYHVVNEDPEPLITAAVDDEPEDTEGNDPSQPGQEPHPIDEPNITSEPTSNESIQASSTEEPELTVDKATTPPVQTDTPMMPTKSPSELPADAPIDAHLQASIDMFQSKDARYSLAFIVACQESTVRNVLQNRGQHEVFLFPRKLANRDCYLLSWGAFEDKARAKTALANFPSELMNLTESVWVVELDSFQ